VWFFIAQVFAYFVVHELPSGFAGFLLAALFGTTMSVFSGGVNSATTCFMLDLVEHAGGRRAEDVPFWWSKAATGMFGAFAVGLAMLAQFLGQGLVTMSQALIGIFAGPLFGVFLLGMCSERANHQGAAAGLVVALAVMLFLVLAHTLKWAGAGEVSEFWFGAISTTTAAAVGRVASLAFPPPSDQQLDGLTMSRASLGVVGKGNGGDSGDSGDSGGSGGGDGGGAAYADANGNGKEPLLEGGEREWAKLDH
jgi:Na+/proline symporter